MDELSLDEAVSQLTAVEAVEPEKTTETEQETQPSQEGLIDSPDEPEAGNSEAEPEIQVNGEQEQEQEAVQPSIEAPTFWNAEAKQRFAELPAELQEFVATQEQTRQSQTTEAQKVAAEKQREAEARLSETQAYYERVDQTLGQVQETFKSRWDNVDWQKWAVDAPAEYIQAKAQYEAEQTEMQRLNGVKQDTDTRRYQEHLRTEGAKLEKLVPELTDPEKGGERKQELFTYLGKFGMEPQQIKWARAVELSIGYKAMMYDRAQTAVNSPKPLPKPKAVKSVSKAAAQSQNQSLKAANKRFNDSGSVDDAVAVLLARGG